jgi:type IV secretion system pilin
MITTTSSCHRRRRDTRPDRRRPCRHPHPQWTRWAGRTVVLAGLLGGLLAALLVSGETAAHAEATFPLAAHSITTVVNNIRNWLVGILVAVATLFLTVGGLRYLAAGGDPGEVEKAKLALKSAAIGYALALLAPLFVTIIGKWVA